MSEHTPRRATSGATLVVALVVLWLLLWRSIEPMTIVTGVVVAVVVVRVFELPPIPHVGRLRPLAVLALVPWFLGQVVVASVQVAAQAVAALSPARVPRPAVIAVPLRSRGDDLLLALTATVTTLIPGTLVVEVDRERATLYLHVLRGGSERALEAARRSVLDTERRLVRAIGGPGDRSPGDRSPR